jgi:hypothetical protein
MHLTGILPEIVDWLSNVEITAGTHRLSLWMLLSAAFWVGVTLLLAMWAGAALEARLMRAAGLHSSLRVVFARLGKAALLIAAVLVVLPLIGVDLTVLSVFGGALGVGLGLGLQKIASNYLSGFIIGAQASARLAGTGADSADIAARRERRGSGARFLDQGSGARQPERALGCQCRTVVGIRVPGNRNSLSAAGG